MKPCKEEVNEFGHGLLHKAVIHNRRHEFFTFLEAGHNINEQDELGFTPLHLATLLERNFILKEILNWKEARKHSEDENEGGTEGDKGVKKLTNDRFENKETSQEKEKCFDANTLSTKGQTALHLAAQNNNKTTTLLLLKIGCDRNIADRCSKTALDVARKFQNVNCINFLELEDEQLGKVLEGFELSEEIEEKKCLSRKSSLKKKRNSSAVFDHEFLDMRNRQNLIRTISLPCGFEELDKNTLKAFVIDNEEEGLVNSCLSESFCSDAEANRNELERIDPSHQFSELCSQQKITSVFYDAFYEGKNLKDLGEKESIQTEAADTQKIWFHEKGTRNFNGGEEISQLKLQGDSLRTIAESHQRNLGSGDVSLIVQHKTNDIERDLKTRNNIEIAIKRLCKDCEKKQRFKTLTKSRSQKDILRELKMGSEESVLSSKNGETAKESRMDSWDILDLKKDSRNFSEDKFQNHSDLSEMFGTHRFSSVPELSYREKEIKNAKHRSMSICGENYQNINNQDAMRYLAVQNANNKPRIEISDVSTSQSTSTSLPRHFDSININESSEISQSNSYYSPVFRKPNLPVIFSENIYRSLSDSDIPNLTNNSIQSSFEDTKALSLSMTVLNNYNMHDDVDYFPHGSLSSPSQFHKFYDWSLCAEVQPPDKDHLTVSMKARDQSEETPMAYSYICSEEEDLEGSFVCSDCGSAIAQISYHNKSENLQEAEDEFVLVCYPDQSTEQVEMPASENSFTEDGGYIANMKKISLEDFASGCNASSSLSYITSHCYEEDTNLLRCTGSNGKSKNTVSKRFDCQNEMKARRSLVFEDTVHQASSGEESSSEMKIEAYGNEELSVFQGPLHRNFDRKNEITAKRSSIFEDQASSCEEGSSQMKTGANKMEELSGFQSRLHRRINHQDEMGSSPFDNEASFPENVVSQTEDEINKSEEIFEFECPLVIYEEEEEDIVKEALILKQWGDDEMQKISKISEAATESAFSLPSSVGSSNIESAFMTTTDERSEDEQINDNIDLISNDTGIEMESDNLSVTEFEETNSSFDVFAQINENKNAGIDTFDLTKLLSSEATVPDATMKWHDEEREENVDNHENKTGNKYEIRNTTDENNNDATKDEVVNVEEVEEEDVENKHGECKSSLFEEVNQFDRYKANSVVFKDIQTDRVYCLRIFFFNFKTEVSSIISSHKKEEFLGLKHAALEFTLRSKSMEENIHGNNSGVKIRTCVGVANNCKPTKLKQYWFLRDEKVFALLILRLADSKEAVKYKWKIANYLLEKVLKKELCSFTLVINWILVFFGLLKSEFQSEETVDFDKSSAILLLEKLLKNQFFKMAYVRQLSFFFARQSKSLACYRKSRIKFLKTCFKSELKDAPFSSRYPIKIFLQVQNLFSNIDEDMRIAFEILDEYLPDYLHLNNCFDFVGDVLVNMGLLKSEFPVEVIEDIRTSLMLLNHVIAQEYFPKCCLSLIQAFIAKPNERLANHTKERNDLLKTIENLSLK